MVLKYNYSVNQQVSRGCTYFEFIKFPIFFKMGTLGPYVSGTKSPRNMGPKYTCVG